MDEKLLERMTALIVHRGPDDGGIYLSPNRDVGLGNRRLAIIDLSAAGHQPMSNEDGTVWITYNGEIYNFPELRAELINQGHRFRSKTDTEVIIHGYEEWGLDVLKRLNGMFALALWDGREKRLLLARDRFGQKPLYYMTAGGHLVFASEIKSILLAPRARREVNLEALHRYMAFLWVPGPETMFKGIYKLPPGHYLIWHNGQYTIHSYWDLCFRVEDDVAEWRLVQEVREVLAEVIERHLVSDVPLGVFLSGGLDSSTILTLATRILGRPVAAYTIAYRPEDGALEQSTDDAKFARLMAQHFGADHHEITVSPKIVELLPKVIWHLDEPVADPAAISTYLICEAARPQVKVLLSGQGGDEIFAGYRMYWTHRLAGLASLVPASLRDGLAQPVLKLLPTLKTFLPGIHPGLLLGIQRYVANLLQGVGLPPEERYVFHRSHFPEEEQRCLYSSELRATLAGCVAGARHLAYFRAVPEADFLNRMLYVDAKTFLPELNLTYSDKLSSAVSVEVRLPFLDSSLIELMARVPPRLKLRGLFHSKYILKKAVDGILPKPILRRRKAGFGAPIRSWLHRDLREMIDDLLSEGAIRRRGYFEPLAVHRVVENYRNGREDNPFRLWAFLTLELWHRIFIDRPPVA